MALTFKLISQNGEAIEAEVDFVKVPGQVGEWGIIENHSASLVQLKPGHVLAKQGKETDVFFVPDGMAHVLPDSVSILCSDFERASDLDPEISRKTKEQMLKIIDESEDAAEIAEAEARLNRAEERLYIIENLV